MNTDYSLQQPEESERDPQDDRPSFWPKVILGIAAFIGIVLVVSSVRQWQRSEKGRRNAVFGRHKEDLFADFLRNHGYTRVEQSPGSWGASDVQGYKGGQLYLFQLKATQDATRQRWLNPQGRRRLRAKANRLGAIPRIVIGLPRGYKCFTLDGEEVEF